MGHERFGKGKVLKVEGSESVLGPLLKTVHGFPYLEGWCVVATARIWDALGGWDENFQVSSWEDGDRHVSNPAARKRACRLEPKDTQR